MTVSEDWRWTVSGTQITLGSMVRSFDASGLIVAEGAGDVLRWLLDESDVWDGVDQREEITLTLSPVVQP